MTLSFFNDNFGFSAYSHEHGFSVLVFIMIITLILYVGIHGRSPVNQRRFLIMFSMILFIVQLLKAYIRLRIGNFDQTEDLPLHLCNMLPVLLALAIGLNSRRAWAVCFLLIMTGTLQSLFTPTLEHSFPHYEYFRYWIIHIGLVLASLIPIFTWKYRLQITDIFWAWISINIIAFTVFGVNEVLGSNYMYMQAKPPGDTIYNILGPWPWYILTLEFVSVLLFLIVYLPFWITSTLGKST